MTQAEPIRRRGRPPKDSSGQQETREALIRAGIVALTERGFSATGIEEILRTVHVPKGSFYHYFASKEVFGTELISRYATYFSRKLDRFLLNTERSPLERIRDFVTDAEEGMTRYQFTRGCLVGNLGQEMNTLPESYRQQILDIFTDWQARMAHCLRAAQETGEIAPEADCDRLAAYFWIGWEGAVLRAKLEQSAAPLNIFTDGFFAGLKR